MNPDKVKESDAGKQNLLVWQTKASISLSLPKQYSHWHLETLNPGKLWQAEPQIYFHIF